MSNSHMFQTNQQLHLVSDDQWKLLSRLLLGLVV